MDERDPGASRKRVLVADVNHLSCMSRRGRKFVSANGALVEGQELLGVLRATKLGPPRAIPKCGHS